MGKKKRQFTDKFKAKFALDAVNGEQIFQSDAAFYVFLMQDHNDLVNHWLSIRTRISERS